jgi:hypothetical protein
MKGKSFSLRVVFLMLVREWFGEDEGSFLIVACWIVALG